MVEHSCLRDEGFVLQSWQPYGGNVSAFLISQTKAGKDKLVGESEY